MPLLAKKACCLYLAMKAWYFYLETGLNFTPPWDVDEIVVSRVMTRARSARNRRVTCHSMGEKSPKLSCHVMTRMESARIVHVECQRMLHKAPASSVSILYVKNKSDAYNPCVRVYSQYNHFKAIM